MTTEGSYRLRASFLAGSEGPLFGLWALPRDNCRDTGVLIIPSFAEEMNRSRRMLSLQARALAEAGFPTLMIDLFGTGDSAGEFADASVPTWLKDLSTGLSLLMNEGCRRVAVLAVRFGALLAGRLAAMAEQSICGFVFWQPVHSGDAFMRQFLRLRLAAELTAGGQPPTVQGLQKELSQGCVLDVGGYELSPHLYTEIAAMNLLEDMLPLQAARIALMEIGVKSDDEPSPVIESLRQRWTDKGIRVTAQKVVGDRFWQTPEITLAPALFIPTLEAVRGFDGAA